MIPEKVNDEIGFLVQQGYRIDTIKIDKSKYDEMSKELKEYNTQAASLGSFSFVITYFDGKVNKNLFLL